VVSHDRNVLRGALFVTGSGAAFALMGVAIKTVSTGLPNEMVVFLRSLFGWLFLLPWVLRFGIRNLATRRPRFQISRALTGLTAMYCFFYAIAHLNLAEAVLLNFSAPLFVPLIAWVWLREPFPPIVGVAVLIGFAGIALILKPDTGLLRADALVGVAAGLFAAVSFVTIRRMADTEPTTRIVFYYTTVAALVSALPLAWAWHAPTWRELALMATAGLLATFGQLLLTRGYGMAPSARVGPFSYTSVVFAAGLGWLIWGEALDAMAMTGAALVAIAGIAAIRRGRAARAATMRVATPDPTAFGGGMSGDALRMHD
jgi:drug/metabolite transporter (DMT)-like permease